MNSNMPEIQTWNTVHLVPPTPFSTDGRGLKLEMLQQMLNQRIAEGIRVVIPAAGTGEFHSLTVEEALATIAATLEVNQGRAKILAPIGLGLEHALAVGEKALTLGADGVLVMPPVHPYLSDDGVRAYFEAIHQALKIKIWVYKRGAFPSDACLLDLARRGVIAGVKYAVNEMNALASFVEKVDQHCQVVCGTAERNAPFYQLAGARGFTSGAAMLFPRLSLKLHAALDAGDYISAMKFRGILEPLEAFRARHGDALNITAIKAGMRILGHDFGPVRPPNRPLSEAEITELAGLLRTIEDAEGRLKSA